MTQTAQPAPAVLFSAPDDLAADRVRVAELAKSELGSPVSVETAQDVFVLVAAPGWNAQALALSTDLTTRAIDAYFNGRFDTKPRARHRHDPHGRERRVGSVGQGSLIVVFM